MQRPEKRIETPDILWEKVFQIEGTTRAKVLRQVKECWRIWETARGSCGDRSVVRDEVKDNRSGGGQMLQGVEDHLEGFSLTMREMENHWELSQGKSRAVASWWEQTGGTWGGNKEMS